MENNEDLREKLHSLFEAARRAKIVRTQAEFAQLVDCHPSNLSNLMTGVSPVSEKTFKKIENALNAHNVACDISGGSVIQEQKNFTKSDHTADLLEEMKAQREMFAEHAAWYQQQIAQLSQALTAISTRKQ